MIVFPGSQRLVLLCLGELGRRTDLSQYGDVESLIASSMDDKAEDIKSAASFALGAITFGNLEKYLASLLEKVRLNVDNHKKHLYLLLHALNEVITSMERVRGRTFSKGKFLLGTLWPPCMAVLGSIHVWFVAAQSSHARRLPHPLVIELVVLDKSQYMQSSHCRGLILRG